ncbi:LacI family transcriptional regulator [Christensenellaceae bacterium OttesenSCG-928-K19]|nr:LacI family transcriptional regulator [Christensenellaceae bacterium OttesenSCG-928-K19]
MGKLSIKDIAKMADVSVAAVSYVINGKEGVGQEQRKKIERIIREHGFTPNLNSKRLVLSRSFNIHVVIRTEAAPACKEFYFGVVARMTEEIGKYGYSIVPAYQSDNELDGSVVRALQNKNTDGLVFFQGISEDVLEKVKKSEVPYSIINPGFADNSTPCVRIDFEEIAYRATSYLAECGHRQIGFIGMDRLPVFYTQTRSGYLRALKENGMEAKEQWIAGGAYDEESARAAASKLFAQEELPTAVFCAQDNFAICAMDAARKRGLKVPDDVSFIAVDDIPVSKYIDPPLTTVPIDQSILAKCALEMMFAQLAGEKVRNVTVPIEAIVERQSVKKYG